MQGEKLPIAELAKSPEVRDESTKVLAKSVKSTTRKAVSGTIRRKTDGSPAMGADLAIVALRIENGMRTTSEVFAEAVADEDGRFEFEFDGE